MPVAEKSAQKDKERLQFDFTSDAIDRLDEIRDLIGAASRAEVIRNALRVYEWLIKDVGDDDTIQVVTKEKKVAARFNAKLLK
jgi:metal-responsive CopG/Arc/MetJ family transcriptional regulator